MIIDNEELFIVKYHKDDRKRILYMPLRSYISLIDNEILTDIIDNDSSLRRSSFFNAMKKRPLLNMDEIVNNLHNCIPQLSIAITDNCNLRCVYCHASAGETHKQKSMTNNMIDSIVDAFFQKIKPKRSIKVDFNGGGEPTFAFFQLKYSIDKIRKIAESNGSTCHFTMATNGCYGAKIRQFIVDNFNQVSLSFDGPDFIQNKQRPLASGKGSFPDVFETAKFFFDANFPFAFRSTISDFSMKYWEEIIDFFAENFPNKSIGFEHLNPFGRGENCCDSKNEITPPSKKKFADRLIYILEYAKDKPIKIINSASTEYDIVRPIFCSNIGVPNWTVDTDGNITACGRDNAPDEFVFGKFNYDTNKILLDENKIKKLRGMVVTGYEECKECFCKYHCAGDCPDRRIADKSDCNSIIKIGEYVLNQKIDQEEVVHGNTISSPARFSKSTDAS